MTDDTTDHEHERDPFDTPEASPAFRRPLAVAGFVLGLVALVLVPIVVGPLGMACGLVSHLKGDRLGFPAAVAAGVGMIVGMALDFSITR
jgi:hypothetical protein